MTSLQMGGGERVCVDLMNNLAERGNSIFLAVIDHKGFYRDKLSEKVTIIDFKGSSIFISAIKYIFLVWKLRPDVLFSSYIHLNPFVIFASHTSFRKTKSIIRIGNPLSLSFLQYRSFKDKFLLPLITKITYKKADTIICVSQSILHDTKKFLNYSGSNMRVIYSPKDYRLLEKKGEEFVPGVFTQHKDKTHLLFVGRLVEQKDPETLIHMMTFLKGKNFHLIILGGGDKEKYLKTLAESLGVSGDISFEGPQSNPYVYMKNADIFVLSSRWEGMPNVLLESQVFQLKVIATDCFPGSSRELLAPETDISRQIKDVIEETRYGFLVPVQKPELFALAVEKTRDLEVFAPPMVINQNISTIEEYQEVFES